jgi:O-antigen ligase
VAWASALSTILVIALLLVELGTRKQGTFANPNIAAHFLVTNLVVLTRAPLPRWLRLAALGAAIVGIVETGSFGAMLMTVGAFGYLTLTLPSEKRRAIIRRFAPLAGLVLILALVSASSEGAASTAESGYNQRHFERSSEGRLNRFRIASGVALEYPFGLGPGSNRGLGLLPGDQEAHNEYLAYLTERGVLGLVGLLLLYTALFRLGSRGGLVRALVIGYSLQSMVRETFHYRHLWLLLAFALVLDERLAAARSKPSLMVGLQVQ